MTTRHDPAAAVAHLEDKLRDPNIMTVATLVSKIAELGTHDELRGCFMSLAVAACMSNLLHNPQGVVQALLLDHETRVVVDRAVKTLAADAMLAAGTDPVKFKAAIDTFNELETLLQETKDAADRARPFAEVAMMMHQGKLKP